MTTETIESLEAFQANNNEQQQTAQAYEQETHDKIKKEQEELEAFQENNFFYWVGWAKKLSANWSYYIYTVYINWKLYNAYSPYWNVESNLKRLGFEHRKDHDGFFTKKPTHWVRQLKNMYSEDEIVKIAEGIVWEEGIEKIRQEEAKREVRNRQAKSRFLRKEKESINIEDAEYVCGDKILTVEEYNSGRYDKTTF